MLQMKACCYPPYPRKNSAAKVGHPALTIPKQNGDRYKVNSPRVGTEPTLGHPQ